MPTPSKTPCPECGHIGLELRTVLVLNNAAGLSGSQVKFPMRNVLVWVCEACDATGPAEVD